ncbi:MAG: ATP-dependent RNA helicase HrpA [Pseudomonadota bacterium]
MRRRLHRQHAACTLNSSLFAWYAVNTTVHSDQTVALMQQMAHTMLSDRVRLIARVHSLVDLNDEQQAQLSADIDASIARVKRRATRFKPVIDSSLPIAAKADDIIDSIRQHPVTIVAGATGSGKTTQLPKLCYQAGFGHHGAIGHTQPRRIAARATAARIAEELGCSIGQGVGYKVRFNDQTGPECQIKLMTDGMLLQEAQLDRQLMEYDCLIIDEAHERSLNIDFLLGLVKRLLKKRPQLRLVITSATINPHEFAEFFDNAPVIEVSGRSYPIDIEYHPPNECPMDQHIADTIEALWAHHRRADVLVFLPGEREIRDAQRVLDGRFGDDVHVLPLYARLNTPQQNEVFKPRSQTRIVLATNVAETSLTVPGIVFVVDAGTARISRYHYRSKLQRLAIEPISQASAAQRAGRCGRTEPGVCARLYREDEFESRAAYTDPEILRTNLASVILRMLVLDLGSIERFEFVQAPDRRFIKDGYRLLNQLQAVSKEGHVTKQGKRMARYPLDPRLAKILVAAVDDGCLAEIQLIAAGLSAGDPRERPLDKQKAADEQHRQFADTRSDFMALLAIWKAWRQQTGKQRQQRAWCRKHFLSFRRLQEWNDVVLQLRYVAKDLMHDVNKRPAKPALIHTALLRGFTDQIGQRQAGGVYEGARGRQFKLFPGSGLAAKPPAWVMSAEIVETSQVFARTVAQVNPVWIERAAPHLLKRRCVDTFWNKQTGTPMGIEEVGLFGFVLSRNRRVPLARHDAAAARQAFIQHALVENRWVFKAPFIQVNDSRRAQRAVIEAKRRQILLDESTQFDAFQARLPDGIVDRKSFTAWYVADKKHANEMMALQAHELGRQEEASAAWYPDTMTVSGQSLALAYLFDPSEARDGATLTLPAALARHINGAQIEWVVPGWLRLKVESMMRALPKAQRKQLVPVNDCAQGFLQWAIEQELPGGSESVRAALSRFVGIKFGLQVDERDWSHEALPDWMRLGLSVVDENGQEVAWSRNLNDLRARAQGAIAQAGEPDESPWLQTDVRQWSFDRLPDTVEVDYGQLSVGATPVLSDKTYRVDLELVPTLEDAHAVHGQGVLRLLSVQLADKVRYLRKNLPDLNRLSLLYMNVGEFDALFDDIVMASLASMVRDPAMIRDGELFAETLDHCRSRLIPEAQTIAADVLTVLAQRQKVRMVLDRDGSKLNKVLKDDVEAQLDSLIYPGFVRRTPAEWRSELYRYVQGLNVRLERSLQHGKSPPINQDLTQHEQRLAGMSCDEEAQVPDYRWLLQEWRVSLFAQELGTKKPVSAQRIERYLAKANMR